MNAQYLSLSDMSSDVLVVGKQHGSVTGPSRIALLLLILLPDWRVNIRYLLRLVVWHCLLLLLSLAGRRYPSQPTPRS